MTQPGNLIDPEILRLAMRRWATGVTVVTSHAEGIRHGMTCSSFTSVSLTPPLVLVSLEHSTRTFALVKASGVFGVTILAEHQREVSERFAGRDTEFKDRFAGCRVYTLNTGAPLLEDGLAGFDCRVVATYTAGTHTLIIGEVVACRITSDENPAPLIYVNRGYRKLARR